MGAAYDLAEEALPGRFVPINMHSTDSDGLLAWRGTSHYEGLYSIGSYPTAVINGIGKVQNQYQISVTSRMMTSLAEEAVSNFPSHTNIMAFSSLSGERVNADVFVAMKDDREYRITAVLLESGIVTEQSDATGVLTEAEKKNYEHKHIARSLMTAEDGDLIPGAGGKCVSHIRLGCDLPSSVINKNNLSIAIYVSCPGTPDSGLCEVPGISYIDPGFVIDNAADLPVNGSVDYLYE